ncbi:hypothetical protein K1719_007071 [Acacia pycnantha]|nr:hypothetical protein K1719_007071 [Acacia pycnantha]
MKLVDKHLALNEAGTVKLTPEEPDDLWFVYNLIAPGDVIATQTTRKVHLQSAKNAASRVNVTLHIKVTRCDFHKDSSTVRVQGNNIDSNPYVAAGSFHTLTLERNKAFELYKKIWNSDAVDALSENSGKSTGADLAVLLFQQDRARLYLLGRRVNTLCSTIETSPSARKRDSSCNVFFQDVFSAFVKHVNFGTIKCAVIAGTASMKDEFRGFLISEAKRLKIKPIEDNKSRIVVVATSSGGKSDLKEVLNDSGVMNVIKDSEVGLEIRAFKELWELLMSDSGRACYGPKNVEAAHEMMAIETLLITEEMYKSDETRTRQKYVSLVKSVKGGGGKAFVYSTRHVSVEQLTQLTGVAAILRFPLPHLQHMDD